MSVLQEREVMVIRPSGLLSIDKWVMAFAVAGLWAIFGMQLLVLVSELAPILAPVAAVLIQGWIFLPCLFCFIWAISKQVVLRFTIYTISNQRIIARNGVFSTTYDEIELLRVRDFQVVEPFYLRLMGLGNLRIFTAENNTPVLVIRGQPKVLELRDTLRQMTLERQVAMGYREVGVGSTI